jgi:HEAT repeat protein
MSLEQHLDAIFNADRALRKAETSLMQGSPAAVATLLSKAVDIASGLSDAREAELRLTRLADLCAQVPGPEMANALVRILDCESPSVRVQAAEALVDMAYDRYVEVARAIEQTLERGGNGPALRELPWVIAEVAEPSAATLIKRFFAHDDPEVIASAIEALAQLGDPAAIPALKNLTGDKRTVVVDDGDEELTATVGELASEAITTLGG